MPLSGAAGYSRGVVARTLRRRAARAGAMLKRPALYDDVRDLCPRPWDASRRRAGARLARSQNRGRAAAVAGRILASHNRTIPRLFSLSAAPATVLQPCATDQITKRRAALLQTKKAAASNFAPPAQVDTMRQTVLALAICGASALQPARNARRQSLAVRQAPRGVRQRVLDGVRGGDTREPTPSPRRHEGGDAREPPPSP